MPDLVKSLTSPYKIYPGNVLALRAIDWIGPSRASLTTESDSRSITGTVIRDSQKLTWPTYSTIPFASASDTVTIPFDNLPIEKSYVDHFLFISFLVEGDWDTTNPTDTIRGADQGNMFNASRLAYYIENGSFFSDENSPTYFLVVPRKYDTYMVGQGNGLIGPITPGNGEILHIRAISKTGTTVSWLIDHIWLFPWKYGNGSPWDNDDFRFMSGAIADYVYRPSGYPDGADGGDNLGKYTVKPYSDNVVESMVAWEVTGGGDYQKKSTATSAEYTASLIPEDDLFYIYDTSLDNPWSTEPNSVHCYGLHGSYIIPTTTWMSDSFSGSSIGDGDFNGVDNHFASQIGWGNTPEGFYWKPVGQFGPVDNVDHAHRHGISIWKDGGQAHIEIRGAVGDTATAGASSLTYVSTEGARLYCDDISVYILGEVNQTVGGITGNEDSLSIVLGKYNDSIWQNTPHLTLRYGLGDAILWHPSQGTTLPHATFSIPWFTNGAKFGIRIEFYRYRLKVRIWDASGTEPTTWNFDDYWMKYNGGSWPNNVTYYPYNDAQDGWVIDGMMHSLEIRVDAYTDLYYGARRYSFDLVEVSQDLKGSNRTSTYFQMEKPEGTPVGQIEIPQGAQQIVYWGTQDWTNLNSFDNPEIEFSMRAWSGTAAPMLQLASTPWWWFRSVHGGLPRIIRYK